MSNGAILLIITECDQYPVNCWIAVPILGDSFQQSNGIANIPTDSFDPLAHPYEVVAFVLRASALRQEFSRSIASKAAASL